MIAEGKVKEVERLLTDQRQSQRAIAKIVGVSRAVVGQIAAGNRPDYAARRRARQESEYEPRGPVARCPGCGMRMYMPCHLCRVRAIKSDEEAKARAERLRERARRERRFLELLRNPPPRCEPAPRPDQRRAG